MRGVRSKFLKILLAALLFIFTIIFTIRQSSQINSITEHILQKAGIPCNNFRREYTFSSLVDKVSLLNNDSLKDYYEKVFSLAQFDDLGRYKILRNFIPADGNITKEPLCVAAQVSFSHISKLLQFVAHWPGPMSFAVFAPGSDFYFTVIYIRYLRRCYPQIRNQVSWHIVYQASLPPNITELELFRIEFNCSATLSDLEKFFDSVPKSKAEVTKKKKMKYPQNVLRNVARQSCQSKWVVCPDIDMVFPSPDGRDPSIYEQLKQFLSMKKTEKCEKCAYVFPLYEVASEYHVVPADKMELMELIANNSARQYHIEVFSPNQECSQLKKWEALSPISNNTISVAYQIKYKFWYEPVYITKHGSPRFDERYIGYGMTRNTQALEMALQGYRFFLLDSIFLSHLWGFQKKNRSNIARKKQTRRNHKLFCLQQARELAVRYDTQKFQLLTMQHQFKPKFNVTVEWAEDKQPKAVNNSIIHVPGSIEAQDDTNKYLQSFNIFQDNMYKEDDY